MGQSVGVYGGVNFNHGDYIVTLDDGPEQLWVPYPIPLFVGRARLNLARAQTQRQIRLLGAPDDA
jgi:hypothetical protein